MQIQKSIHYSSITKWEERINVILLIYFSGALSSVPVIEKPIAAASYVFIFFLVASQWRKVLYCLSKDIPILILTLLAVISIFWSYSPQATLDNLRGLIRISLYAVYFAARFSLKEQLKIVFITFGIGALLSLFIGILIPNTGIAAENWKGGFGHKNYLARTMVMSIAASIIMIFSNHKNRRLGWSTFLLSLLLIILSRGKTAIVQFVFMVIVLLPFRRIMHQQYKVKVLILGVTVPLLLFGGVWFLINFQDIAINVFNKSNSLSGRSQLLEVVWNNFVFRHPWLGYGYSGFWDSHYDEVMFEMSTGRYGAIWVPDHSHNGYLDTILNLGFVGLFFFLFSLIPTYIKSIILVASSKDIQGFWCFLFLTIFIASNFNVQLTILSSEDIQWALYISTSISLALLKRNFILGNKKNIYSQ